MRVAVILGLRLFSEVTIARGGMWWHHGRVYIWRRCGPLMMMMRRAPEASHPHEGGQEIHQEGFDCQASAVSSTRFNLSGSRARTNSYRTDSGAGAYLKRPYLSPPPRPLCPTVLRREGHRQAINEKTIPSNKVRVLFLEPPENLGSDLSQF